MAEFYTYWMQRKIGLAHLFTPWLIKKIEQDPQNSGGYEQ
jgi:hypothetical protein